MEITTTNTEHAPSSTYSTGDRPDALAENAQLRARIHELEAQVNAWTQTAKGRDHLLICEQMITKSLRVHLGMALSSLEDIAAAALEMADKVEDNTPMAEVNGMFITLSNHAAQAITGHVWMALHRD